LRRDLADENVARLNFSTDIGDASFVEVLQCFFRNVRNIAGDFLRPKLGVTSHDLELLDVNRGEDVVGNDPLGQEDGVLVVVAVPRHERDEHVTAESQITEVGRRTVRENVALVDTVADTNQRTLVDAGRLVRTLELHQTVDIDTGLAGIKVFRRTNNDTRRINLVDNTATAGTDSRPGVTSHDRLHAGADERS